MTYQNPFDCMNDCAQGTCRNRTTGCQWQCEARKENGQTAHGLPVVEIAVVGVGTANIAQAPAVPQAVPVAVVIKAAQPFRTYFDGVKTHQWQEQPKPEVQMLVPLEVGTRLYAHPPAQQCKVVYCTPTEHEGRIVYEHTDAPIPMSDNFKLYTAPAQQLSEEEICKAVAEITKPPKSRKYQTLCDDVPADQVYDFAIDLVRALLAKGK